MFLGIKTTWENIVMFCEGHRTPADTASYAASRVVFLVEILNFSQSDTLGEHRY